MDWDIVFKILLTLIGAGASAWLAINVFFRQREHELIIKRYLEGCIDLISGEIERQLAITNQNWSRSVALVGQYGELKGKFDFGEFSKGFLALSSGHLNIVAHGRLKTLVGCRSTHYWTTYLSAMATCTTACEFYASDVRDILKQYQARSAIETDKKRYEFIERLMMGIRRYHDEVGRYDSLVEELQVIGTILESKKLSFTKLSRVKDSPLIAQSVARLKARYPDGEAPELPEFDLD
jgi:hypothetical protein